MKDQKSARYLWPADYMADPSVHVFDGKIYIYPSHDWDSGAGENDNGDHFEMKDYHVLSIDGDPMTGTVTDHGKVLDKEQVLWGRRQMWDCDVACKDGKYYMYFPMKDKNDVFRMGVATADNPAGPFTPLPDPVHGSYSIDYCIFEEDGKYYAYFGGLWGGQLQRYRDNLVLEDPHLEPDDAPALPPRIVRLTDDMLQFAEEPRPIVILDPATGSPLKAGDNERRFFEASWVHKYNGKYYLSYSTGDTHRLCYATADNPYGPFTYQGCIMTPVVGWTTHHSIIEYQGQWYIFFHDCVPSGDVTWLRSLKVMPLEYDAEGRILTIDGGGTGE